MTAAKIPSQLTTLAVATAGDVGFGGTETFGGESVGSSDVLVMYTYAGDADLSGSINGDDYFKIDQGYSAHATGYANGDFNYDGRIDADDYFIIDSNYSRQGAAFSAGSPLALDTAADGSIGGVQAVPEPAAMGLLIVCMVVGIRGRRRAAFSHV